MRKHYQIAFLFLFLLFFTISKGHAQDCSPDVEPPTFEVAHPLMQGVSNGDTLFYQCGEQDAFFEAFLLAVDNCDPSPSVQFSKEVTVGNCPSDGFMVTVEYCWSAADMQGNESQFCFSALVTDEVLPYFDQLPADLTIDLAAGDPLPPVDVLSAFDDCFGVVNVSFDTELFIGPDSCGYELYRIWSAADGCGNETSHQQIITAIDDCEICPVSIIQGMTTDAAECGQENGSVTVGVFGEISDYQYILTPNAGTQTGDGNQFINLPANEYELLVVHQTIPDCKAIINFTVGQESCNDTLEVTIYGTEEFCLPDNVFDFSGDITSSIFCGQGNPNTVLGSMADSLCLDLVPAVGFTGLSPDLLCIVHCFDNNPSLCDSTFLEVTVIDCQLQVDSVTVLPASCADNDGSITVFASGQVGGLSFDWEPSVTVSNFVNLLNSNEHYSVTLTDGQGCEVSLENLMVGMDCPNPNTETLSVTLACGVSSIDLCTNTSELFNAPISLSVCLPPANGSLAALNDSCFIYSPNPDFSGEDEVCLSICDDLGICDTFLFEILVEQCPQQFPCVVIPEDTLFVQTTQCDDEVKFCVEFPLGEIMDYNFEVNGLPYSGNLSICAFDTLVSYGFSAIPGNAMNGPYEITSWIIDGNDIGGGDFEDVFELIELMNMLDPQGNWALDSITFNISSFTTATQYGQMTVTQQTTGDIAMLNINSATAPTGSALYFPVGVHEVIMTHQDYSFCIDTFTVFVHCSETQTVYDEIQVGESGSFCPSNTVPGQPDYFEIICSGCENTSFTEDGQCIDYQGLSDGTDSFLLITCDNFGFCDSTWLIVTVIDNGLPLANIDYVTTNENTPIEVDALDNDFTNGNLVSFRILIDPIHGLAVVNPDQTLTFTPDRGFCGLDAFAYEICNEVGCDTSAVDIEVICTSPMVFNGFSPNEDGINDVFKVSNLNHYPSNELKIFNRWGTQVYRQKNYDNSWDGRDFDRSILPDGTYFYLLDLGNGDSMSGYVQIHR